MAAKKAVAFGAILAQLSFSLSLLLTFCEFNVFK